MTYFDAKREVKKIYRIAVKAIKRQDYKYINYLTSVLDQFKDKINDVDSINKFGKQVIHKEIKYLHNILIKNRG